MAEVKHERRRLTSQWRDGTLMYPGVQVFTWFRSGPGMPWMLAAITPLDERATAS